MSFSVEDFGISMSGVRNSIFITTASAALMTAAPGGATANDNYQVTIKGVSGALKDKLEIVSTLAEGKRELPTIAAVRRVAAKDADALTGAMKAAGYYAATVDYAVEKGADDDAARVIFTINSGPAFTVTQYRIIYSDDGAPTHPGNPGHPDNPGRPDSLAALKLRGDGSAEGARLQATQQQFLTALWDAGYPAARITGRRAEASLEAGAAVAIFTFESGPRARFGDVQLSGALKTEPAYLRKLRTWEEGESFERSKLIAYRDKLAATGLFSAVDVAPGAPGADGIAPVIVTLEERKRRTIGAGVSYSTAEGPGGRLFLEYRNMFGAGEQARVEIEGNQIEQSIQFGINKPLPGFPGDVFAQFGFTNETTDAFNARTVNLGAGLSRQWLDGRLTTRGGVALETSNIRQDGNEERTYFVSIPLLAVWDTEDDPLTLAHGARAALSVTPYTGTDSFTQAEFSARSRLHFASDERLTLAARTRIGATFGSSLAGLPLNKRFYAGGGSSVRGFDFQEAGPLDGDGDPIGGRSIIEAGLEARLRIVKNIQLAAFTDTATVSASRLPDPAGDYFIGAGGGVRYFTPIGPLRVDFAIPLDKRETDSDFQLYISLGQPF